MLSASNASPRVNGPEGDFGQASAGSDEGGVELAHRLVGGNQHQHAESLAQNAVTQIEQSRQRLTDSVLGIVTQ